MSPGIRLLTFLAFAAVLAAPLSAAAATSCCVCTRAAGANACRESRNHDGGDAAVAASRSACDRVTRDLGAAYTCSFVADSGRGCTTQPNCAEGVGTVAPLNEEAPAAAPPLSGTPDNTINTNVPFTPAVPTLALPIPSFSGFSTLQVQGDEGNRYVDIPFVAEYILAIYRFSIGVIVTLAMVMIVIGGLRWVTAAGNASTIGSAKDMIVRSVMGLLLALGSYTILYLINPDLVQFRSIRVNLITRVDTTEDRILAELGSLGDPEAYAGEPPPDLPPGEGSPRSRMNEACRERNGLSLPAAQQITRLREIVNAWGQIGSREAGAIYINGGNASCTSNHARPAFLQALLPRISGFTEPACGEPRSQSCIAEWRREYDRLVTTRANAAGMLCGDCATTVRSLYSCFQSGGAVIRRVMDNRPEWNERTERCTGGDGPDIVAAVRREPGNPITPDRVTAIIPQLRFGDILGWVKTNGTGHVFMYTGGAGLGFEILEMGGGGSGDISSAGGRAAWSRAGIPINNGGSGMRLHRSASAYLRSVGGNNRSGNMACVYAWRIIR